MFSARKGNARLPVAVHRELARLHVEFGASVAREHMHMERSLCDGGHDALCELGYWTVILDELKRRQGIAEEARAALLVGGARDVVR